MSATRHKNGEGRANYLRTKVNFGQSQEDEDRRIEGKQLYDGRDGSEKLFR